MILLLLIEYFMTSLPQMCLISCKKLACGYWYWSPTILFAILTTVLRHNINGSFKCVLIYEWVFIMRQHFAKNRMWKSSSCVWECVFPNQCFIWMCHYFACKLRQCFSSFFHRENLLKRFKKEKRKEKKTLNYSLNCRTKFIPQLECVTAHLLAVVFTQPAFQMKFKTNQK